VEIYDTQSNLLFPSANENATPMEFVPKRSNVICMLQCGGIWVGGKGWGLTWKLAQCVVKPQEMESVFGKCNIMISDEASAEINKDLDETKYPEVVEESGSSYVEDSDDDQPRAKAVAPVPVPVPAPVPVVVAEVAAPVVAPTSEDGEGEKKKKKMVVKKSKA
jgi:hypothetical protein